VTAATLYGAAQGYASETTAPGSRAEIAVQRAYMAGALEALVRMNLGEPHSDLLKQVLDFGRTVGTSLETAT